MSDSETSTDINIDIIDNKGKISNRSETKKSSDTDYYMNLLANQNKTVPEKHEISSDSELVNSDSSSSKQTSSVKSSSSSSSRSRKSNSSRGKNENANVHATTHHSPKKESSNYQPSTSSAPSIPSVVPSVTTQLTPQEMRIKKIELLRKLAEIKAKGFSLTKEYDFNSSIEEMEY